MTATATAKEFDYATGTISFPPEIAVIEVTNRCNLDCTICYRRAYLKEVGDMDFSLFKKIARAIKGAKLICCQGGGEPLLHPRIFDMLDYLREVSDPETIVMTTNATVLDREMARRLASSKLDTLHVSIDGSDRETYERIRGFDFNQVVENVRHFKSISRIRTVINFTAMKETLESLLGMPNLMQHMGVESLNVQHLLRWNPQMHNLRVVDGAYDRFERIRAETLEEAKRLGVECTIPQIGPMDKCDLPFRQVYYNFKGKLAPCCVAIKMLLEKNYANVNGARIREWRRRTGRGNFPKACREFCYVKP